MLGATVWLSLATLAGLAAGFAREWLLIRAWGQGARTDAFLVAMFLPEAWRMMLAGGLLNAAALPLYQGLAIERRPAWLGAQTLQLGLLCLVLAGGLSLGAPWIARGIGPGLGPAAHAQAAQTLRLLAWTLPGVGLQALLAIPQLATARYLASGLNSLLYNLPAVGLLFVQGAAVAEPQLALAFVGGSVLMAGVLAPEAWRSGWRPWRCTDCLTHALEFYRRWLPLLTSALASQALSLLERICASYLGAGAITLANLARKLNNLPLVALMSLNQVLLGLLGQTRSAAQRLGMLRQGLGLSSLLTVPAAAALIVASPVLAYWLLPDGAASRAELAGLLAWMATGLVFGGWNAGLARYAYAQHDTRTPTLCELTGSLCQALGLLLLTRLLGLDAIAIAALIGTLVTGGMLNLKLGLNRQIGLWRQWAIAAALLLALGVGWRGSALAPWPRLSAALGCALLLLLGYALWLKPWRRATDP